MKFNVKRVRKNRLRPEHFGRALVLESREDGGELNYVGMIILLEGGMEELYGPLPRSWVLKYLQ